jgi:hypothetical protein
VNAYVEFNANDDVDVQCSVAGYYRRRGNVHPVVRHSLLFGARLDGAGYPKKIPLILYDSKSIA